MLDVGCPTQPNPDALNGYRLPLERLLTKAWFSAQVGEGLP